MPHLSNNVKYYIAKTGPVMETVSKSGLIHKANTTYGNLRELEQLGQTDSPAYEKALGEFLAAHYALPMAEDESDVELDKPFDKAVNVLHLDADEVGNLYQEMKDLGFDPEKYNPEKQKKQEAPVVEDDAPILKPKQMAQTPEYEEKNEDAPVPVEEKEEKLPEGETIFIPDEIRGVNHEEPKKDEPVEVQDGPQIDNRPQINNEPEEMPEKDEAPLENQPAAAPRVDDGRVKIEEIPEYPVPEVVERRTAIGKYMAFISNKFAGIYSMSFLNFATSFARDLKTQTKTAERLADADRKTRTVGCDPILDNNFTRLGMHESKCLRGMLPLLRQNVKDMSFFAHPIDKIRGLWAIHSMKKRAMEADLAVTPEDLQKDQNNAERFFNLDPHDFGVKEAYKNPENVQREVLAEQATLIRGLGKIFGREKAPKIDNEVKENDAPIKDLNVTPQPKK